MAKKKSTATSQARVPGEKRHASWLRRYKERFGTRNGLPGPLLRAALYEYVKRAGQKVAIVTPHGSILVGKTVMRGSHGWVLNLGGKHGTPGTCDAHNIVWVQGAPAVI